MTPRTFHFPRRGVRAKPMRGVALIETMVGILIFTTGILGVIGLQAAMTRAQGSAQFRAEAAMLAGDVIGTMWADSVNLASANLVNYTTSSSTPCTHTACAQWVAKVESSLPGGVAEIGQGAAAGEITVTISWTQPTDGTHSYVTSTFIR